ncbi:MAG: hypothetical protein P4L99_18710, partial [Chthoniobacter sp.]|nr:hypothetical protein [Chthoniobacter sp.]
VLGCIHRWLQPRPHLIADQFSLRDFAHPKLPSSFAQRVQIIREHCLDREGSQVAVEATSGVGTRYRSVYRLCNALPAASAIVVSQDGGMRIVRQVDGKVTYWEQLPGDVFGLPSRAIVPAPDVRTSFPYRGVAEIGVREGMDRLAALGGV